jgi:ubiquinol-cytochrome c reductase cytochrome c subunit
MLIAALAVVGVGYAAVASIQPASAAMAVGSENEIDKGEQLYLEGCSSCHGLGAQGTETGPTLIGVGAAGVDFQVSTGRMPLVAPGAQAPARNTALYTDEETRQMAAYIASLAPGPAIPTAEQYDPANADAAIGGELFRINCSQCHQAAGQGGALTQGKYAPNLMQSSPKTIYQAMLTGPQNMPVFSDAQLTTEDKQHIIKYITTLQESPNPGGLSLGRIGPVTEGVFLVTAVFAVLLAAAVWIGIKAR